MSYDADDMFEFIHFHDRFYSGKGRDGRIPGGLEIPHGQLQSQIDLLTPHEDGTK